MKVPDLVTGALQQSAACGAPVNDVIVAFQAIAEIAKYLEPVQPQVASCPGVRHVLAVLERHAFELEED